MQYTERGGLLFMFYCCGNTSLASQVCTAYGSVNAFVRDYFFLLWITDDHFKECVNTIHEYKMP